MENSNKSPPKNVQLRVLWHWTIFCSLFHSNSHAKTMAISQVTRSRSTFSAPSAWWWWDKKRNSAMSNSRKTNDAPPVVPTNYGVLAFVMNDLGSWIIHVSWVHSAISARTCCSRCCCIESHPVHQAPHELLCISNTSLQQSRAWSNCLSSIAWKCPRSTHGLHG